MQLSNLQPLLAKYRLHLASGAAALLLAVVASYFYGQRKPEIIAYNPAFDAYLSAYTGGDISRKATIKVRFADDVAAGPNAPISEDMLAIEPSIEGQARWADSRTLEFVPKGELNPGQLYKATVAMPEAYPNIPKELEDFEFQFRARPRKVNVSPLSATARGYDEDKWYTVTGRISTSDVEDPAKLAEMIAAQVGRHELPVSWTHSEDGLTHEFTIDSVARQDRPRALNVSWNGSPLNIDNDGEQTLEIPSKKEFKLLKSTKHDHTDNKYILLEFSDELDRTQSLEGLIRVPNQTFTLGVEDNKVKIYLENHTSGAVQVIVEKGIQNLEGLGLKESKSIADIIFEGGKPELKAVGKGVIMPRAEKLPFIFQAANLKSVDVRIVRINEKNVPQFLQTNSLDGNYELRRVGKVIVNKRLDLDKTPGLKLDEMNNHSVDLASLINPEPGAIYQVSVGFRKSYAVGLSCPDAPIKRDDEGRELAPTAEKDNAMFESGENWDSYETESEMSFWDYYDDDYGDYDNPCSKNFYSSDKGIERNILTSDLGIVCKAGSGGMFVAVTDFKTTNPMSGIELQVLDFQHAVIATGKTDKQGQFWLSPERRPHLIIAKQGEQRGYLRMTDGDQLILSRYDVSGAEYKKGLKGFIYGERGVWRPGDELFLNFMLEDKDKTLPANHPVTFELLGPRGQVVQRIVKTEGLNGLYNFTCKTEANAYTGAYLARVRVGSAVFEKIIKIESIMPNRLKMAIDFGKEIISQGDDNLKADLKATWLHGAPGRNLKADVKYTLRAKKTEFKKYKDYNFDDPATNFNSEEITLFEGTTNDDGIAKIPGKFKFNGFAPGMLDAWFKCRVFEPGGNFSVDNFNLTFSPYKHYVGVKMPEGDKARGMLLTDKDHTVRIMTVDENGNPANRKVTASFYKLDWRWWYDNNSGSDDLAYNGQINREPLQTAELNTVNGEASWNIKVSYPEWGRYLVRVVDEKGHASGRIVFIDWPNWAGRSDDDNFRGPAMLEVACDKSKYLVGENVRISIPTAEAGRCLVTVESGTKVLKAEWVDAQKGQTSYSFATTKDMAPNVFVTVSLLQPHAQTANDLPMRMYGLVPVKVDDPTTLLEPTLAMADELEPSKDFTVKVAEKKGKAMTYTIAIVDEGLLGLTRFRTPQPWDYFYQRQALGVKTWDLYDQVIGAFKGEVKSRLSIGGDGGSKKADFTDRFKPVVLYLGPFECKAGETKTHSFKMPNYVGEVRAMVVACQDGAYGQAEKGVPVRQPLMVLGTLPRVLGPGEELQFPLTIFSTVNGLSNVSVKLETNGLFETVGESSKSISIKSPGEAMTAFGLKVKNGIGTGHVKATVSGGGHSSVYETDIEIRPSNPMSTEVMALTVEPGQSKSLALKPRGIQGTNSMSLEFSAMPAINMASRLKYLIQYPYGCVEQTTSAAFPQLYVGRMTELSESEKAKVDKNIKDAIYRLRGFMTSNGSFAYWPGQTDVNDWANSYVGHFLLEAKQAGYTVPEDMLSKWKSAQKNNANAWTYVKNTTTQPTGGGSLVTYTTYRSNDLEQAYRLLTLSMAGAPELGAMNRLRLEQGTSDISKYLLAAAFHLAGQTKPADELTAKLQRNVAAYNELSGTYGSQLRDQSAILYALSIMGKKTEAAEMLLTVAQQLGSETWYSTQGTAWSLMAVSRYVTGNGTGAKMDFNYKSSAFSGNSKTDKPLVQVASKSVNDAQNLNVDNKGNGMLFVRVLSEGIPEQSDNSVANNGINLSVSFASAQGRPLTVDRLEQGTDFTAIVTVENTSAIRLNELAINQMFPTGWEIVGLKNDASSSKADFQDVRDDRVHTFFDLAPKEKKTFRIMVNAAYAGKFYMPQVKVEAMYDRAIHAHTAGRWVEVAVK